MLKIFSTSSSGNLVKTSKNNSVPVEKIVAIAVIKLNDGKDKRLSTQVRYNKKFEKWEAEFGVEREGKNTFKFTLEPSDDREWLPLPDEEQDKIKEQVGNNLGRVAFTLTLPSAYFSC